MFQKMREKVLIMIGMILLVQSIYSAEAQAAMKSKEILREKYIVQVQKNLVVEKNIGNIKDSILWKEERISFDDIDKFLGDVSNTLESNESKFRKSLEYKWNSISEKSKIALFVIFEAVGICIAIIISIYNRKRMKQRKIEKEKSKSTFYSLGEDSKELTEEEKVEPEELLEGILRVDKMSGSKFESFLADYFISQENVVERTGGVGDYGGNLIVYPKEGQKFVVQAKRSNGKIDLHAVQEVIGAKFYYGVLEGWVITNSYFTQNAKILAASAKINLWDRDDIIQNITKDEIEKIDGKNKQFIWRIEQNECPVCQGRLILKTNQKNGNLFVGCTNYPDCKYTDDSDKSKTTILTQLYNPEEKEKEIQRKIKTIKGSCPRCGRTLILKNYHGRVYTSCIGWGIFDEQGRRACKWSRRKYKGKRVQGGC